MIEIREFDTFGKAELGWLSARHHFSFGEYTDPQRMNWGALRVWNDDTIQPGKGFERHGHRDMEIITFVRSGAITHRDHLGNEGRTVAGDIQVMSAGQGIFHEEFNREDTITQIFQIWILPAQPGGTPYWETRQFPQSDRANQLIALASGRADKDANALPIRQDAALLGAFIKPGGCVVHKLDKGRLAYAAVSSGTASINDMHAPERSGVAIRDQSEISIAVPKTATAPAEIILVDIPPA